jgi:hypothetical protein
MNIKNTLDEAIRALEMLVGARLRSCSAGSADSRAALPVP